MPKIHWHLVLCQRYIGTELPKLYLGHWHFKGANLVKDNNTMLPPQRVESRSRMLRPIPCHTKVRAASKYQVLSYRTGGGGGMSQPFEDDRMIAVLGWVLWNFFFCWTNGGNPSKWFNEFRRILLPSFHV